MDNPQEPRSFSLKSMLIWVTVVASAIACLAYAWKGLGWIPFSSVVFIIAVASTMLGSAIAAPIGYTISGKTGSTTAIVIGGAIGCMCGFVGPCLLFWFAW